MAKIAAMRNTNMRIMLAPDIQSGAFGASQLEFSAALD
jgi:hypothetical protein